MNKLASYIDRFTEQCGKLISWLTLAIVVLIGFDVLFRYAFNKSTAALFELEWHLFAMLFMLGLAYTFKYDKHVRVDVFYTRFSTKKKALVNLLGTALFLIPFCIVAIKTSIPFVLASYQILESSADPGGLPYRFIIKAMIPVGFTFLLLQAVSELIKSWAQLTDDQIKDSND